MNIRQYKGFTLVELIVTVAILGILAAIAYPAYTSHIKKSNMAAAQAYLMDIAQKQAEYLVDNRAYATTAQLTALGVTAPDKVASLYDITVTTTSGPPPTFIATATPKSGTMQAGEATLTINQAGTKTPSDKW
jgi:type IV pilus assembly protein PilE